ncbi:MAG: co-chaperone GroES [Clostridia bacterium]|nr:co-chaperone GroES [Clostridia bacterium]
MKIKPLYDRVVLEPEKIQEKTYSGIMLPEVAREKSQIGKVVAVGQGGALDGNNHKIQVEVGDRVLYSKYAGTDVKVDGKMFVVVRQTDVLAVICGSGKVEVEEDDE